MGERITLLSQILNQAQQLSPNDFNDWTRGYFQNERRRHGPDYPSNSARLGTVVHCPSHPEYNGWPMMSDLQQGNRILLIGDTALTADMLETFLRTAIITTPGLVVCVYHADQSDSEKEAMSERLSFGMTFQRHTLVVLPHLEDYVDEHVSSHLDWSRRPVSYDYSPGEVSDYPSPSSRSGIVVNPDRQSLPQLWDNRRGLYSIKNVTIIGTLDPSDENYRNVLPPSSALLHYIAIQSPYISQLLPEIESLRSRLLLQGLSEEMRSRLQQSNHLLLCHTKLDIIKPY